MSETFKSAVVGVVAIAIGFIVGTGYLAHGKINSCKEERNITQKNVQAKYRVTVPPVR